MILSIVYTYLLKDNQTYIQINQLIKFLKTQKKANISYRIQIH